MSERMTPGALKRQQAQMTILNDWQEILATLDKESGPIALDLETSGLYFQRDRIAVIAMYGKDTNTAGIIHLQGADPDPQVVEWLSQPGRHFITHNGTQFDIPYLQRYGVKYRQPRWYDTLIGEQTVLTSDRKDVRVNLKDTIRRRLQVEIPKDVDHATWMLPQLDADQMRYLADDIFYLPRLALAQHARAEEQDRKWGRPGRLGVRDALAFEQELAPIVSGMIMRGLPINTEKLSAYTREVLAQVPAHTAWLKEKLKVKTINHAPSVRAAIDEVYGIELPDTRAATLAELLRNGGELGELAHRLLNARHGGKRGSMYASEKFWEHIHDDRLYGNFWQVGTNTGRFSSSNPNLQQIPRDMRYVFEDVTGELAIIAIDYSAIEVRCAADIFDDAALLEALEAEDIHTSVAASLFGIPESEVTKEQRRMAKAGSFTLTFGGGYRRLWYQARANGSDVDYGTIAEFGDKFLSRFQGVARAREKAYWLADQARPVPLTFPTGLRRVITPERNAKGHTQLLGTTILNNMVQATAAAGLKHALLLADQRGLGPYLAAVVHDEVIATAPWAIADEVGRELERAMIDGMAMVTRAPVAVERKGGKSWG